MKYEIQKRAVHGDQVTWYMIAQTDIREYAVEIVDSLNALSTGIHRYIETHRNH